MLEWADSEVTLQALRRKTAEHFHGEWRGSGVTARPMGLGLGLGTGKHPCGRHQ